MKILILDAGPRRKRSFGIAETVSQKLHAVLGSSVEVRRASLREYELLSCLGCFACLARGEELCPRKDRLKELLSLIDGSDCLIVVSPNYAMQVPALLKNLLDRIAWTLHRPRFFGRRFAALISQASYGGSGARKYLEQFARVSGFSVTPGIVLGMVDDATPAEERAAESALDRFVARLARDLRRPRPRRPGFFSLAVFRGSRSAHKYGWNKDTADYRHFRDAGWFHSAFYYPVKLGLPARLFGALVDAASRRTALSRNAQLSAAGKTSIKITPKD